MLSLSPRYDLFKISFPKDFLPTDINSKYEAILKQNPGVVTTPIDYLNESIQGVSMPGLANIVIWQGQHSYNPNDRERGKINVEPWHEMWYQSRENPLNKIDKEFKVTFRMNQGLYNYFMLYETALNQVSKHIEREHYPLVTLEILSETGQINARVLFKDVLIESVDGLEFNYSKIQRDAGTFDVSFKFSNIDFEFNYK